MLKPPDPERSDWRLLIVVETFHLRQDCEQNPTIAAKLFWNFCSTSLSSYWHPISLESNTGQGEKTSWVNCLPSLFLPLWAPPYPSMGHHFPNAPKTSPPIISKNALKLFHKLKIVFKYPLYHLDLNENWLSPRKPLPHQRSEVGHAYFLYAANSHPGAASRLRVPVSCFRTCSILLIVFSYQSQSWSPALPPVPWC